MKKTKMFVGMILVVLFFGIVGSVGAHIEIREFDVDETRNATGFLDYKNEVDSIFLEEDEEYTVIGTITVYNDGILILKKEVELEVISFHGFAVNRPEIIEFEINMTEGLHKLIAYIESGDVINEAVCDYSGDIEEEEEEEDETEGDWLPCPSERKAK